MKTLLGDDVAPRSAGSFRLMILCFLLALMGSALFLADFWITGLQNWPQDTLWRRLGSVMTAAIFLYLLLSSLLYYLLRCISVWREIRYRQSPTPARPQKNAPLVTILVPAYREEIDIIRQTLLSAALQSYGNRRVVLLVDDPPYPADAAARAKLDQIRALPAQIQAMLRARRLRLEAMAHQHPGDIVRLRDDAANWFETLARDFSGADPATKLLRDRILLARARDLRGPIQDSPEAAYQHLLSAFTLTSAVFERKLYANLSHEPNKAMNLNGYIHLIGKSWRVTTENGQSLLTITDGDSGDYAEPDAKYIISLDADSLILPDYAQIMVDYMEQPAHQRMAIVQCPYASLRDAESYLERMAGAQTDAMYWLHEGMTAFNAASWVGASALLRLSALREIAVTTTAETGYPVTRYVRDRTVTEDAETSVALLLKGWRVHNLPQRLSFSATPGDFGAFLIQRRRWATGGPLLVPKLLAYLWQRPTPQRLIEVLLRLQYLLSGNIGAVCLLAVLLFPFKPRHELAPLLMASGLCFMLTQLIEIRQLGRRKRDFIGLMALGLCVIPVNLSGLYHSCRQILSGRRGQFGRTPKIASRTAMPRHHILAQWGIAASFALKIGYYAAVDVAWQGVAGAGLGLLVAIYGLTRFLGWRAMLTDLAPRINWLRGVRGSRPAQPAMANGNRLLSWTRSVLMGDIAGGQPQPTPGRGNSP